MRPLSNKSPPIFARFWLVVGYSSKEHADAHKWVARKFDLPGRYFWSCALTSAITLLPSFACSVRSEVNVTHALTYAHAQCA